VITAYESGPASDSLPTAQAQEGTMMPKNEFPPGWDEQRVRDLIAHYETQTH
jgi:hypothetical protein